MSRSYYNEFDPRAAAWLRELIKGGHIAPGDVDERSIVDVKATDLVGYTQCHFFAGIGGWSYGLRLAGWPDDRPVWTGSCPCQPFSSATHGRVRAGLDLWPDWHRLIDAARPACVFGEEAPSARWLDRTCDDMAAMGYATWAEVLPACCVGADHARHRLYFASYPDVQGESAMPVNAEVAGMCRVERDAEPIPAEDGVPGRVGLLRGYGNAIVPQVAQAFIEAYVECVGGAE